MPHLLLKRLLLVSTNERKARSIDFHPKATLISGINDTGKSSLLKSLMLCFGAEPPVHSHWKGARVTTLLSFSVDEAHYRLLRQGRQFTIFYGENEDAPAEQYLSVTNGIGLKLAEILRFGLRLVNQSNESVVPPPAYLLLPYYFDQDKGWSESWRSFERLSQMKNWRQDVIEYHTGIRPNAFYELKGEQTILFQQRDTANAQLETLRSIRSDLQDQLHTVTFSVSLDEFRAEVTELLVECEKIQRTADKVRERLVALHNERIALEAQVEIAKASLKELGDDYAFLQSHGDHIDCPTCGAGYTAHFRDQFQIAVDEDSCEELLVRLAEELGAVNQKIKAESVVHAEHAEQVARIQGILAKRKEQVELKDLIEHESKQKVSQVLREKFDLVNTELLGTEQKITQLKRRLDEITSRDLRERINAKFRDFMRQYLFTLSVHGLLDSAYRSVTAKISEQGSDLPRALLAYGFSILQVMREHTSSVFCPIVMDSPIQQEQDQENHLRILEFIRDHRPKDSQLVLSVVDSKGVDFGGDHIVLSEPRSVLTEDEYDSAYEEMRPFVERALRLMEGGLL